MEKLGDFLHLGAGREAQLEAGDVRAADDADDPRLDPEMAERLDQLAADLLVVARVRSLVALALFQHLGRRRAVVDLLRFGDAALVAHRRQRERLLLGDLLGRVLDLVDLRLEILGDGLVLPRLLGNRHGRLEVVVLGIGAHHVGRAGLGLEAVGLLAALFPPPRLAVLDRRLGDVAAAAHGMPHPAAEAAEDGRDRGAGDEHRPDRQHQQGDDLRADPADQVFEPGFEPVADLAAVPAEEQHEGQVDAGGDQEEADQVEVALLQPLGQVQPRAPLGLGFRPALGPPRRGPSLLAHEHSRPFDAGCPSPAPPLRAG